MAGLTDTGKSRLLLAATGALVVFILSYSLLQEYVMPDMEGYLKRRAYYESAISKKGLSLHKGSYWKKQ